MYFFSFCLSPCQFHSLTYSSCWQHFYISKTPSSVEKKNLPFPMTIRKSPGSYSYSRSVTNSSLNRSLKPKGRCAIRGRLAQVMTWFPEDRLPLGRLSPRLRLKGSLFCCCQYSLTRTGHIAPLNHRGQGSTILSCAQNVQKSGILANSTDECQMYYMAQIKHPSRSGGRANPTTVDNM